MSEYRSAAERPQPLPMMARVTRSMRLHRGRPHVSQRRAAFVGHTTPATDVEPESASCRHDNTGCSMQPMCCLYKSRRATVHC